MENQGMPGGFSGADIAEAQTIANSVRPAIESQTGKTYTTFTVTEAQKQVVAGINWLCKITVDDGKTLHAKIHIPLPHKNEPNQLLEVKQD